MYASATPVEVDTHPSTGSVVVSVSELARSDATEQAVRRLVGHSGGVRFDVYTSRWAMAEQLREAVALVPPVATPEPTNVLTLGARGVPEGAKMIVPASAQDAR